MPIFAAYCKHAKSYNFKYKKMKKIETLFSVENVYAAPTVSVLNIQSESVLCSSTGGFNIPDWEKDTNGPIEF